jgi:hypothetical protein
LSKKSLNSGANTLKTLLATSSGSGSFGPSSRHASLSSGFAFGCFGTRIVTFSFRVEAAPFYLVLGERFGFFRPSFWLI